MKTNEQKFLVKTLFLSSLALFATSTAFAREELAVAVPHPISEVSPLEPDSPLSWLVLANVGSRLTAISSDGKIKLDLAEELSVLDEGKTWTFSIPPASVFPNGRPLSAEALKSSFEFYRKEAAALSQQKSERERSSLRSLMINGINNIAAIEIEKVVSKYFSLAVKAKKISIKLNKADYEFDKVLALMPIVESDLAELAADDFGKGTHLHMLGPYQVLENKPDSGILLRGNPNFLKRGFPRSRSLEIRHFENAKAALKALRVGAVDIIALSTPELLKAVEEDPTLSAIPSPFLNIARVAGEMKMRTYYWSNPGDNNHRLMRDKIIVRKSLEIDQAALARFDLSGTFLP